MNISPKVQLLGNDLADRLAEILTRRDRALMTQAEYEVALDEIRAALPPDHALFERDLSNGGTRYLVRQPSSGRCVNMFEFHRSYSAAR